MIRARVEPDLKHKAEEVFPTLGLSATEAITLFYKQVALLNGLPFEVKLSNAETLKVIHHAHIKENLSEYENVDELMAEEPTLK